MIIKKFNFKRDYEKCIQFLTDCYAENKNIQCWLPGRFDDFVFRIGNMERHKKSVDFIYLFEENNKIIGLIAPDGEAFNSCIKRGQEHIFAKMVDFAEEALSPLFEKDKNGPNDFYVISHDSLTYQAQELQQRGYVRQPEQDFDNVFHPLEQDCSITLPRGFRQTYGADLDETMKAEACHYGFHPENDDGILTHRVGDIIPSFQGRKKSRYFKDSFESLIITDDGDICSYSFCYVDRQTNTGFIEPVSTREKYRHRGFCRQMIYGIMNRLKQMGIENAYINSYDWRRKVYNAVGFKTEDSISYWLKKIPARQRD
ncbi:MAG: GNAT family N-acetyltransferase [Alphaproteobacteria bacterium]|nr:GNAT family N-acetyltransferase [Alphaproteobacteria bacterium]